MAKADRLQQLDLRRVENEQDYRTTLIAALEDCARGRWGLFGHTKDRQMAARVAPVLQELDDLAIGIDRMRDQLGIEPFALHPEFLAARGPAIASAVGEPKQAKAWLERLARDAAD
ncbi:hypothetical protein ASG11_17515 [Sphingomonas sp. Leaf357]|uniref:hypothetical protein n=1 Tax=Sphingomonas sp. Leaf357 TaxID=1736350 RepID=UPI0006F636CD|nr:hypothetical protein [Sphingomonas sp. Leaf357]KQS01461.1 hypothetical protein ASG11_17515 [Sphingomonas sp. Leaf357]